MQSLLTGEHRARPVATTEIDRAAKRLKRLKRVAGAF
jgi:hypothetical protein